MSENASINLATVGTAELEAMSVQAFASCLDTMSGEAIARFRRMRKLSNSHRTALEKYLIEHPEKRPGGEAEAPAPKTASGPKGKKPKKTKKIKQAKGKPAKAAATTPKNQTTADVDRRAPFPAFKRRLRAWWEGVSVQDLDALDKRNGKRAEPAKAPKATPAAAPTPKAPSNKAVAAGEVRPEAHQEPLVTINRAEMLQMLWGEGHDLPGGADFVAKLVKDIDLPADHPCLDIGAGLGGNARAMAQRHKIVVEGIEADPLLAEMAGTLSANAKMSGLTPVTCADPMTMAFNEKTYSAIFVRETLFTLPNRKKLLARVVPALRPLGSIVLTDFMLSDRETSHAAMKAWREAEQMPAHPYTVEEYSELLDANHFAVKGCDDLSAEYIGFIQQGWKNLHTYLQKAKLSPETATMLMDEGRVWLARCKALESGHLRLISIRGGLRANRSSPDATSNA